MKTFKKMLTGILLGLLFLAPVSAVYAGAGTYPGTCPLIKGEDTKEKIFTEYKGKKIHFCCKRCLRKFESNPEKYIKRVS